MTRRLRSIAWRWRAPMALPIAAAVLLLWTAAKAPAAQTLGEAFPPESTNCTDITWLQTGSPGGQYTVPSGGVITSWTFHAPSSPPQVKFKVARAAGGGSYTIIGESELKSPPAGIATTYTDVRISVASGDVIGFYIGTLLSADCGRDAAAEYTYAGESGDQPVSATPVAFNDFVGGAFQFDISATLEPDCDADGFGDETQDTELTGPNCPPQPQPQPQPQPVAGRNLTLDANKNKVKEGKKVTLSGQVNQLARQGPCESNQPVQLQRKRPSQTSFTTVEELQTNAAGNFTTKEKVKRTYQYRAQVAETPACAGQTSNTEKVKVKKPK
jgi:hypothetical protein